VIILINNKRLRGSKDNAPLFHDERSPDSTPFILVSMVGHNSANMLSLHPKFYPFRYKLDNEKPIFSRWKIEDVLQKKNEKKMLCGENLLNTPKFTD